MEVSALWAEQTGDFLRRLVSFFIHFFKEGRNWHYRGQTRIEDIPFFQNSLKPHFSSFLKKILVHLPSYMLLESATIHLVIRVIRIIKDS